MAVPLPGAVFWDMDGLLVDTEPIWTVAEIDLARRLGGAWDDQIKAAVVGTRLDVAVPGILTYFGHEPTPEAVREAADWLLARMVELYAGPLTVRPGATALLCELADAGVPQALVSSSYRRLVDAVLGHGPALGWPAFATVVAGDEVEHGKPHPEPYLTAAARLGVDAAGCVVLEDAPSGVASGEAAGCAVVAVPSLPGVRFTAKPRRRVVDTLAGLRVADLAALVG